MDTEVIKLISTAFTEFTFTRLILLIGLFLFTVIIFNADKIAALLETVAKLTRRDK